MPETVFADLEVRFPVEPAELWPYVADTNRFNRAVGLPPVHYDRPSGNDGETQYGELRAFGFRYAHWIEHPFEWERPSRFSVVRDYLSGPLTRLRAGADLYPEGSETRVRFFAEMTPSSSLFAPVLRHIVGPRQIGQAQKQFQHLADFLARRTTQPFVIPPHVSSPGERQRIRDLADRVRASGCDARIVDQIADHLEHAIDEDVSGMRPLELAQRWGTDPRATLETFLHAATHGLVEMHWELLCPSCRGVNAASITLHDLANEGVCSACNLHFSAATDEGIEARFYPASAIRPVSVGTYCVGGPMNTPHRYTQLVVPAGGEREVPLDLPSGAWIVRSPQSRGVARVDVSEQGAAEAEIRVGPHAMRPDTLILAPGAARLHVVNERQVAATIALDDSRWSDLAATPGRLMTYPAFRSLFSAEALSPGVELAVGRIGLMFTDLSGSTAMYERAGDAAAFRLVSEHFVVLREAIERHGGALIKTIGDAVMAAFPDGQQALEAALAIQAGMRDFDTRGLADPAALVKIGVHAGPCFVVTLNGQLDYFGTTVNVAARAQGEAHGGEVVLTARTRDEIGELPALAQYSSESFPVYLRGISAPVELVRLDCRAGAAMPVTRGDA